MFQEPKPEVRLLRNLELNNQFTASPKPHTSESRSEKYLLVIMVETIAYSAFLLLDRAYEQLEKPTELASFHCIQQLI